MRTSTLQSLLTPTLCISAALLTLSARADLQEPKNHGQNVTSDRQEAAQGRRDRDDDDDDKEREGLGLVRLPTGQFVTPTALDGAIQQYLNPGCPSIRTSSPAWRCARG